MGEKGGEGGGAPLQASFQFRPMVQAGKGDSFKENSQVKLENLVRNLSYIPSPGEQ